MNNARRVNALIWIGNVVLIIGIVAFALQFLILQETRPLDAEPPVSVPTGGALIDPTDTQALGKLANPLLPVKTIGPDLVVRGPTRLLGTFRVLDDPQGDTACLELPARKLNVNAYMGEPIRDDMAGQEVAELNGWRLKGVTPKTATFTTPNGEVTLQLEEITNTSSPTVVPMGLAGTPWDPSRYTTKKDAQRSNDNQEFWNIDRKEIDWAGANVEAILQGVSLEPYAGVGLKISQLPEGTFAAERGLRTGDVIKNLNSQPIDTVQKLQDVMRGLSKNASTLTVVVDRSGRLYTLTYVVPRAGR